MKSFKYNVDNNVYALRFLIAEEESDSEEFLLSGENDFEQVGMIISSESINAPDIGELCKISKQDTIGPNNVEQELREEAKDLDEVNDDGDEDATYDELLRCEVVDRANMYQAIDVGMDDEPVIGDITILLVEEFEPTS